MKSVLKDQGVTNLIDALNDVKKSTFNAKTGVIFETEIKDVLQSHCFTLNYFPRFAKHDNGTEELWISETESQIIKKDVLDKTSIVPIKNKTGKSNLIIYQPYGTQNFPDFLIFTDRWVIPLEIKFTTKSEGSQQQKPKWNSNLPKGNTIYIFATNGGEVTFFLGSDFLGNNTRLALIDYYKKIKEEGNKIINDCYKSLKNQNKNENPFGLKPYIRTDYIYSEQFKAPSSNSKNLNLFNYAKANHWEENVLNFLKNLMYEE